MKKSLWKACLLWVLCSALTASAQVDTATVTGTVRDATGAVVPSATLTAAAVDTGIKTAVKSGSDGTYVITPQPDPFITDGPGAAGVITSTVIPQRQIQFALKLHF